MAKIALTKIGFISLAVLTLFFITLSVVSAHCWIVLEPTPRCIDGVNQQYEVLRDCTCGTGTCEGLPNLDEQWVSLGSACTINNGGNNNGSDQCTPLWGNWGSCSQSCGSGTQTRRDGCGHTQTRSCNTQSCPSDFIINVFSPLNNAIYNSSVYLNASGNKSAIWSYRINGGSLINPANGTSIFALLNAVNGTNTIQIYARNGTNLINLNRTFVYLNNSAVNPINNTNGSNGTIDLGNNWTLTNWIVSPNPINYTGNAINLSVSFNSNRNLSWANFSLYNSTSLVLSNLINLGNSISYNLSFIIPANLPFGSYSINLTLLNRAGNSTTINVGSFSYVNHSVNPTCTEYWTCSSWDDCSHGEQTRTCTDANSCGTIFNLPSELRSCSNNNGNTAGTSLRYSTSAKGNHTTISSEVILLNSAKKFNYSLLWVILLILIIILIIAIIVVLLSR